jgi:hypothetical protein
MVYGVEGARMEGDSRMRQERREVKVNQGI